MLKTCPACNKAFETKYKTKVYCSKACSHLKYRTTFSEERACPSCGIKFTATHKGQKLCHTKCREKILRAQNKTWVSIREFVLERDNYTCQDCRRALFDFGLEVHHIKPVYKGGSNEERNLISLCHQCHKVRHGMNRSRKIKQRLSC